MTASEDDRLTKRATAIPGLDGVTGGGLPAAGATLIVGSAGAGKTIFGLQLLANAIDRGGAGVFVSFEESPAQIRRSASSFDWGPGLVASDRAALVDARMPAAAEAGGAFDLEAMISTVGEQARGMGAEWLVVDGIDRLLRLQPDTDTAVAQMTRLADWCEEHGISLVYTGKLIDEQGIRPAHLEGLEFMLSTVLVLSTELVGRRLNRRFRIAKYRGSAHETDELALVINDTGLQLPYDDDTETAPAGAATERLGTGIPRLDELLGGGIHRGSTVLISGQPGTSKTTLAAAFARAAVERGERVIFLSFDELADRIVRNMTPVGLDLSPGIASGLLRMETREAWNRLIEEHYIEIQRLLDEHRPHCLVIDPVSALLKAASAETAYSTTERILARARARGITCLLTSLTESDRPASEATLSHTSTLADTWITLDYNVRLGERNRALSIVKSRGTAHSNQVRELLLGSEGIDLADVYEFGSEVLMGTARVQKRNEEERRRRRQALEREQRRRDLEQRVEVARLQMQQAQNEAERLQAKLAMEQERESADDAASAAHTEAIRHQRTPGPRRRAGDLHRGNGREGDGE